MNEEIKSCHLTQAGQTARFRQFGRPVLGGNFLFPHSSGSGLMVFLCNFYPAKIITKPKCSDFFFTLCSLQTHSVKDMEHSQIMGKIYFLNLCQNGTVCSD